MIVVPKAAFRYLLLQRTDYLVLPANKQFCRVVCRVSKQTPFNVAVSIESRLRRRAVQREFDADMQNEYADIRSWLPTQAAAILDVGCGLAGIDVLLFEHYRRDPGLHLYLLDRTQTDETITYGYKNRGDFYNSLEVTRQMLVANGVPGRSLTMIEANDRNEVDLAEPLDLIISLISWGFHYPVSTYLDRSHELLKPGGRLIIDVRADRGGLQEIEATFGNAQVISEGAKRQRVMAIRGLD